MRIFKDIRNLFNLSQEQLGQQLSISKHSISSYESGKSNPSFKVLAKMTDVFNLTLDFILQNNECLYPRNLKLIKLAQKLDKGSLFASRKNISDTVESLLGEKSSSEKALKQDSIEIKLTNDFHSNLKNIRNLRNITQSGLAESLGITRTLLSQYELRIYPTVDKLPHFSKLLAVSIHALSTGEKLSFDFKDQNFGQAILAADHFLSLEEHKMLIHLMETVLKK